MNHAAIEKHYRSNFNRWVKRLSSRHGWQNAEDIVQNVYLRALAVTEKIDNFDRWFMSHLKWRQKDSQRTEEKQEKGKEALRNYNHTSTASARPHEPRDAMPDPRGSPDQLMFAMENAELVQEMIARKSPKTAGILSMVFLWGSTYQQTAGAIGVSYNAVQLAAQRFRQEIRDSGMFS